MATPYNSVKIAETKTVSVSKPFYKKKSFFVIPVILVIGIIWYNSDFWPWPSKDRINKRLDAVIEACNDNEYSSKCKELQSRYNMTFRYCQRWMDYTSGKYDIFSVPYYAVAWEGKSNEPPKDMTYVTMSSYSGCKEHLSK